MTDPNAAEAIMQTQAFCDGWRVMQAQMSIHIPGVEGDGWTLAEPELRAVLAERDRLAARVAELESERADPDVTLDGLIDAAHRRRPGFDEDVRVVAEACADLGNDEGPRGIRQLYARFADRIAELEQRDAAT